jgi:glycerol uptake facilitator-like aquaporin
MDVKLRMYLAELFGTFVVVLIGAGAVCSTFQVDPRYYYAIGGIIVAAALAYGFALAVAVSFTSYLSPGCCNPAITLALFVMRKLERGPTLGLIGMQLLGSFLAGLALRSLFSETVLADAHMGTPHLRSVLSDGAVTLGGLAIGVVVEMLCTFVVTLAAFANLIDRRAPRLGGIGVGLAQVAVVLFAFHLTGGAANPARWFGPALWQLSLGSLAGTRPLADHAVYWLGPIVGALAAAVLYVWLILPPEKK